jgi:hypothetical protein
MIIIQSINAPAGQTVVIRGVCGTRLAETRAVAKQINVVGHHQSKVAPRGDDESAEDPC